ncbi:MAG: glutamate--tRNA ligase, partial [Candidatus Harrisonbacteria bacterium]|nr:glutamate--tRNA ligase [Candidatus Harrisonbacteria bacterium]
PFEARYAPEKLSELIWLVQERMHTLRDFFALAELFITEGEYDGALLAWKKSTGINALANLTAVREALDGIPDKHFEKTALTSAVMPLADARGRGEVLWPLRVALSGREASPGPLDIAAVLGKAESLKRITRAIEKL